MLRALPNLFAYRSIFVAVPIASITESGADASPQLERREDREDIVAR